MTKGLLTVMNRYTGQPYFLTMEALVSDESGDIQSTLTAF